MCPTFIKLSFFLIVWRFFENWRSLKAIYQFVRGVNEFLPAFHSFFFLPNVEEIWYLAPALGTWTAVGGENTGLLWAPTKAHSTQYIETVCHCESKEDQDELCALCCSLADMLTCCQRNVRFVEKGTGGGEGEQLGNRSKCVQLTAHTFLLPQNT